MILLLLLVRAHSGIGTFVPGLLLFGAGIGVMLTSSVNVVQSSFPDDDQGDISGLSRSVSNLGSSLGTALVGSVLVAVKLPAGPAVRRRAARHARHRADRARHRGAHPARSARRRGAVASGLAPPTT